MGCYRSGILCAQQARQPKFEAVAVVLLPLLLLVNRVGALAPPPAVFTIKTPCGKAQDGYTRSVNVVMQGSEAPEPYGTLALATAACNARLDCFGISAYQNATVFYLKTNTIVSTRMETGSCLYTKTLPFGGGCTTVSGYTVVADAEATGMALEGTTSFTSLSTARAACETSADCRAISRTGISTYTLYKAVFPLSYTRASCVFVKMPTECAAAYPGYVVMSDQDIQDAASNQNFSTTAFGVCNLDPACSAFSSSGAIRTATKGTLGYSRGKCAYVKANSTSAGCPAVPGYVTLADTDMWTTALSSGADASAASTACTANNRCAGFSSDGWKLKRLGQLRYKYGTCFYAKPTSLSPPPPPPPSPPPSPPPPPPPSPPPPPPPSPPPPPPPSAPPPPPPPPAYMTCFVETGPYGDTSTSSLEPFDDWLSTGGGVHPITSIDWVESFFVLGNMNVTYGNILQGNHGYQTDLAFTFNTVALQDGEHITGVNVSVSPSAERYLAGTDYLMGVGPIADYAFFESAEVAIRSLELVTSKGRSLALGETSVTGPTSHIFTTYTATPATLPACAPPGSTLVLRYFKGAVGDPGGLKDHPGFLSQLTFVWGLPVPST